MKHLYFIRHDECQANLDDETVGQLDSPLTDNGRLQAIEAGKQIEKQGLSFDLVISSPLTRASETAEIVAKVTGYPDNLIMIDKLLIERALGPLEGPGTDRSYFKEDAKYPEIDNIDGAESVENLQIRATKFYDKIKGLPENTILIVGHGMFGRSLKRVIDGQPYLKEYQVSHSQTHIPHGEIIQFI